MIAQSRINEYHKTISMKIISLFIAVALSLTTMAQITKVSLQASGLTCSMCSNAINKALNTLDFIEDVKPDIKTYTFEISFKPNSNVDFEKIKKKVEDAGFSVSGFIATINFENVTLRDNTPIKIGANSLIFMHTKEQILKGEVKVRLLDKGFISSKEYKTYGLSSLLTERGIYHVTI